MNNLKKITEKFLPPDESERKGKFGIRLFPGDKTGWNCPNHIPLYAPHAFYKLSANAIDEATGGCGPGEKGDRVVPDTAWGLRITRACRIHDFMYSKLCTATQKTADRVFLNNMRRLVLHGSKIKILIPPRRVRVKAYYLAVKYGGKSSVSEKK
jgi:hypothetical protein